MAKKKEMMTHTIAIILFLIKILNKILKAYIFSNKVNKLIPKPN